MMMRRFQQGTRKQNVVEARSGAITEVLRPAQDSPKSPPTRVLVHEHRPWLLGPRKTVTVGLHGRIFGYSRLGINCWATPMKRF